MSILDDPAATRHIGRLRLSSRFIPSFAALVIYIGVAELIGVGWFASNKWTQYVENTDRSHAAAVKAGMIVGVNLGGGIVLGVVSIAYGLWALFRRKTDALLLRVWDEGRSLRAGIEHPAEPDF